MDENENLKPCPFCGEEPGITKRTVLAGSSVAKDLWTYNQVEWTGVECFECGFGYDRSPDAEQSAIELWNTRK